MKSVWGVVHKSYIPKTGKFVRITDPGAKDQVKRAAMRSLTPKGRYGQPGTDHIPSARQIQDATSTQRAKAGVQARRRMVSELGKPKATRKINGRTVNIYAAKTDRNTAGYHFAQGGKRGTSHVVVDAKDYARRPDKALITLSHELAHARPQRTAYRHTQISRDRAKIGREEARADAEGRTTNFSGYQDRARLPLRSKMTRNYRDMSAQLRQRRN